MVKADRADSDDARTIHFVDRFPSLAHAAAPVTHLRETSTSQKWALKSQPMAKPLSLDDVNFELDSLLHACHGTRSVAADR